MIRLRVSIRNLALCCQDALQRPLQQRYGELVHVGASEFLILVRARAGSDPTDATHDLDVKTLCTAHGTA